MRRMGLRTWLYGPPIVQSSQELQMPHLAPLSVNIDDLRDLDAKLRQSWNDIDLWTLDGNTRRQHASFDEALALPAWDRKVLTWETSGQPDVVKGLFANQSVSVSISTESWCAFIIRDQIFEDSINQALSALALEAKQHIAPKHIRHVALALIPLAIAAIFGWLLSNYHRVDTIPLVLLLALAVVPIGQQAWRRTEAWYRDWAPHYSRIRLEMVSRSEAQERRYNRKRDRTVALYTGLLIGPIGAALGVLITILVT